MNKYICAGLVALALCLGGSVANAQQQMGCPQSRTTHTFDYNSTIVNVTAMVCGNAESWETKIDGVVVRVATRADAQKLLSERNMRNIEVAMAASAQSRFRQEQDQKLLAENRRATAAESRANRAAADLASARTTIRELSRQLEAVRAATGRVQPEPPLPTRTMLPAEKPAATPAIGDGKPAS